MASKSAGLLYPRELFLRAAFVPELVGSGFGKEIGFGGEDLSVKQFGFDSVVNAFDSALALGQAGGIKAVLGVMFLFD